MADSWNTGRGIDFQCGIFRIVFPGTGADSDSCGIVPGEVIPGLAELVSLEE